MSRQAFKMFKTFKTQPTTQRVCLLNVLNIEALTELENHRPQGVGEARWREALKDGRRFVETWGSQAADLGWIANDLFGLHPIAPLARYDAMGLLWLLHGRPVVSLTATEATIQSSSGATLSFQRAVA